MKGEFLENIDLRNGYILQLYTKSRSRLVRYLM